MNINRFIFADLICTVMLLSPAVAEDKTNSSNHDRAKAHKLETKAAVYHEFATHIIQLLKTAWYPPKVNGHINNLVLEFEANESGSVTKVSVLRSSGLSLLDSTTVQGIKDISPLPMPFPEKINGRISLFHQGRVYADFSIQIFDRAGKLLGGNISANQQPVKRPAAKSHGRSIYDNPSRGLKTCQ